MYCPGIDADTKAVTCGGHTAFDLYKLQWAEAPTSKDYVGCFKDMPDDRVMQDKLTTDDMTDKICRSHCESKMAKFYGTQVRAMCLCRTTGRE